MGVIRQMSSAGDTETAWEPGAAAKAMEVFNLELERGKRIYSKDQQHFVTQFDQTETEYLVLTPLIGG